MATRGTKLAIGAGTAAVIVSAVALIAPHEGYFGRTYRDIVNVPTVCYGETDKAAVAEGRVHTFTKAECLDMLQRRLPEYDAGLMRCIKRPDLPASVHVAGLSFTYNVGIGGACRSSFVRLINAGQYRAACNSLMRWNRAGGREVRGLTNRRADERRVCLQDLGG
jgi:GH24 family phage-related lysozyme (muramidase)